MPLSHKESCKIKCNMFIYSSHLQSSPLEYHNCSDMKTLEIHAKSVFRGNLQRQHSNMH